MKKAISVILIAAAAFGFYGGAVDINDVLDSKDYWEEQGRITDENLDKLQDGVDQLEENTQAYKDGLATYEDGLAQYNAGLATYKDGLKTYEEGKVKIAETEKLYGGEGVPTLKEAYDNVNNLMSAKGSLDKASSIVAGSSGGQVTAAQAKQIYQNVKHLMDGYTVDEAVATAAAQSAAKDPTADIEELKTNIKTIYNGVKGYMAEGYTEAKAEDAVAETLAKQQGVPTVKDAYDNMANLMACNDSLVNSSKVAAANSAPAGATEQEIAALATTIKTTYTNMDALVVQGSSVDAAASAVAAAGVAQAQAQLSLTAQNVITISNIVQNNPSDNYISIGLISAGFDNLGVDTARAIDTAYQTAKTSAKSAYVNVKALMEITEDQASMKIADASAESGATSQEKIALAEQIKSIYTTVIQLVSAGKSKDEAYATIAISMGKATALASVQQAYTGVSGLVNGYSEHDACATVAAAAGSTTEAIQSVFENIAALYKGLSKDEACAMVANAAGKTTKLIKQAYAGYIEYNEGKAQLAAAPAQLAAGKAKLDDAEVQLADGKAQLKQYEDGEEELRDGLKTLMDTKAEGGLESIASRVGEDEDFTDAEGYVDFTAANKGVKAGREYSDDSGAKITPELTNRGIAAGVGLGAAALALIAGILGLANKKKGAGTCGILAAIAGVVAIVMTKSAGDTWSVLAGSTVGTMPLIAFGVVAGVALIAALVQFAGKEA